MVLAIGGILFTLLVVIGCHELGHAYAARIFAVKIRRIVIGFGTFIFKWKSRSGIEWAWAAWPLGGYVELENTRISPVPEQEHIHCFDKKPIWIRILILLAGGAANVLLAWLALFFVFYWGISYQVPLIGSVHYPSLAAKAGLSTGDQLIALNGRPTHSWPSVGEGLIIHWGSTIHLTVAHANQPVKEVMLDLKAVPFTTSNGGLLPSLGVSPDKNAPKALIRAATFFQAVTLAIQESIHLIYFYLMISKQLLSGIIPFATLLGPIGLFSLSAVLSEQGISIFLNFIANFSIAIAFINFLPLPGLDGGSILYALLEKVRGKPVSVAIEVLIHRLMRIIVILGLIQLVLNDLARFFAKGLT